MFIFKDFNKAGELIDNDKREIIFSAGGKEEGNPYHIYFYKVDFSGNNLICLTPEKGSHTINPSPNWDYFVTTYSTTKTAPKSILKDREGKTLLQLSSSNTDDLILCSVLSVLDTKCFTASLSLI